ncbi:hypothetical protein ACFOGG_01490 [Brenneria rubrifaciens]
MGRILYVAVNVWKAVSITCIPDENGEFTNGMDIGRKSSIEVSAS